DFIDPLFAVILHIGFVHTVLADDLMHFAARRAAGKVTLCELANLLLGFTNILLSWHGYHRSILEHPIRGGIRFYMDVLCLVMYLYIVLYYQNLLAVLWLFVGQFVLFWLWDAAKAKEYPSEKLGMWKMGEKTFGWGAVLLVTAGLYTWVSIPPDWRLPADVV